MKTLFLAALALALLIAPARAQVFLDMSVSPFSQSGLPGTLQSWDVILTNNTGSSATVSLNSFLPGFPLTPDVDVNINMLPIGNFFLADGDSLTLNNLFTTQIQPTATPNVWDAVAEMNYDATDSTGTPFSDLTAAADWQLEVQSAGTQLTPEAPSGSLALGALMPVLGIAIYRRRSRAV
ncbi:MAG: hypothetical protein QM758_20925 [Armatimonas sp.]